MRPQISALQIIIPLALIVIFLIYYSSTANRNECESRVEYNHEEMYKNIDFERLYRPISQQEINYQLVLWETFNAIPNTYQIIDEFIVHGRRAVVVQTNTKGNSHYSAVFPPQSRSSKNPLIIWANGLNQRSPVVSLNHRQEIKELVQGLKDYYILIPSFRGQSLNIAGTQYCSDGFFGDAFDGATDDTLMLLETVLQEYQDVDRKRLAIYGVSRGGTVALLAGIRNAGIKSVIAQSGPTNFLGKQFLNRYGKQYRYQFFSQYSSEEEMRSKILKSSPIHFIQSLRNRVFLIHGKNDPVVDISHAREIIEKADSLNLETLITHSGHSNHETSRVLAWLRENN